MSIQDIAEKIKPLYTFLLLVVVASIFFALGRLSVLESQHRQIQIQNPADTSQTAAAIEAVLPKSTAVPTPEVKPIEKPAAKPLAGTASVTPGVPATAVAADTSLNGAVIGSKSGKKYYFPWCGTIKRVKPENQVPFPNIAAARAAGYLPAANCKGLK